MLKKIPIIIICFQLYSCNGGPSWGSGWGEQDPDKTCSGLVPDGADYYDLVLEGKQCKRIAEDNNGIKIERYYANSKEEAINCYKSDLGYNQRNFNIYESKELRLFILLYIDYSHCDFGTLDPPECIELMRLSSSLNSATECAMCDGYTIELPNKKLIDITSQAVSIINGQIVIDYSVIQGACPEGCFP